MNASSNERLSSVFEMLVNRLHTVEHDLETLKASDVAILKRLVASDRRTDSKRPLGQKFNGNAWCSRDLDLVIHQRFDERGEFDHFSKGDVMIIEIDEEWGGTFDCTCFECGTEWAWEKEACAALGDAKYSEIRSNIASWYVENPGDGDSYKVPTIAQVDIGPVDGIEDMYAAMYTIAFRKRYPGFLAFGTCGIVCHVMGIAATISMLDSIAADLGVCGPTKLDIHVAQGRFRRLAIAMLDPGDLTRDALSVLSSSDLLYIRVKQDNEHTAFPRWALE